MPTVLLTPSDLSDLSLLLFLGSVLIYLLYLILRARRQGSRPVTELLLAGGLGGVMGFVALTFLERTLYPSAGQLALPMQTVFLAAGLVCTVQFAYRFPTFPPRLHAEARLALWITLLFPVGELIFALYRYVLLSQGEIRYRPGWPLGLLFIWLIYLFVRKIALADDRAVPFWRKVTAPPHLTAVTTRNFALLGLMPAVIMVISLLRDNNVIPPSAGTALISTGVLLTLLLFVLVYINARPEQTSFLVKFVAVSLVFALGMTGTLGHAQLPDFVARYQDPNTELSGTALRFEPNQLGGYTVDSADFVPDPIGTEYFADEENRTEIGFPFPFYGTTWTDFYVSRDLFVTFGHLVGRTNTLYQYGGAPAIFALHIDLEAPIPGSEAGLFIHRTPEQVTVTWLNLPDAASPQNRYTAQMVLYPDGAFKLNFIDVGHVPPFGVIEPWRSFDLLGALPGNGNRAVAPFTLETDLPFVGGADGAAVLYHLRFRQALHAFLLPILGWMLASAGLLILSVPLYFRAILVAPLDRLMTGIKEFEQGNYDVAIPVGVNDEFGSLAGAFNTMSTELDQLITDLEGRVAQRTAQLAETAAYLDNILRSATEYAIITTDRDLRVTYFNPLAEELFGIRAEDALGRPIVQIAKMDGPGDRFREGMRRVEQEGSHEYVMVQSQAGADRTILSRISGIRDSEGRLIGYARFSRDITERRATENRLVNQQRSIAALEERAQIGRELHDRLGQIFGFLSLQSQTINALFTSGNQETGLIALERLGEVAQDAHNQVREFILGMKDDMVGQRDLREGLRIYADRLRNLYDFRVILDLPSQPEFLLSPDKELHLLRIIQEALNNARRHSGADQATVRFRREEDTLVVTIADQGEGFDTQGTSLPGDQRLVDLAHSGDANPQEAPHFGLSGMAERAGLLGGVWQIDSSPEEGTCVEVRVPVEHNGTALPGQIEALRDLRVLLVDDQPIFLEGLNNLLTAYGLNVVGMAHDGAEAQELARSARPDVIVMDIHMPVCDGIEATRRIKAENPQVDIVMLSVSAEDETLFEALKAGASGYLLKSMRAEEFFLLISGLTEGIPPLAPELAGKVLAEFRNQMQVEARLSEDQRAILGLVAQGRTYAQIGMDRNMSERTVRRNMKEIMALLHVKSRAEAERYAKDRGM